MNGFYTKYGYVLNGIEYATEEEAREMNEKERQPGTAPRLSCIVWNFFDVL